MSPSLSWRNRLYRLPLLGALHDGMRLRLARWLERRSPKAAKVRLNQRQIFILPTPSGWVYLAMVFAIFIGGINYSNSLILVVSFLLVSLFLVAILHTYANLAGVHVSVKRHGNAFAGEQALIPLQLSAELHQRGKGAGGYRQHASLRLLWGDCRPVMVDLLDTPQANALMLHPVNRRGLYMPPRLRIESQYPLGLLCAWSSLAMDCQCLVYPRPKPCPLPDSTEIIGEDGERIQPQGFDDFAGLRIYQPGDNPRHIAWHNYARTYAQGGELYSKVFVSHSSSACWLDWAAFSGRPPEERLSCLCYWVCRLSEQGQAFGLRLPGESFSVGQGTEHMHRCLGALATFGEVPAASGSATRAAA